MTQDAGLLEYPELVAKVIQHDTTVNRIEGEHVRLGIEVRLLTGQVKQLGLAIGMAHKVPIPRDWEEITQVRRPELRQLEKKARRGNVTATGLGAVIVSGLIELVRACLDGRIRFHH